VVRVIIDDVRAELPTMREQAESLMTDTCLVEREVKTWDPVAKKSVTSWSTVHADLPCQLRMPAAMARTTVSDQVVTQTTPQVKVKHDTPGIQPDDRITVRGKTLWVTHVPDYSHMVQCRIECREVR